MKVKSFDRGFCSQNQFARLIGRSATFVYYLRLIGVVKYCAAGVLIARSLRQYFNSYLPPNIRRAEMQATVERIKNLDAGRRYNFLESARDLQLKINCAQQKLILLKFINQLDAGAATFEIVASATRQLKTLLDELPATKDKLRRAICAASLPPAFENVLLRRYVDCESWKEIEESTFALSTNYKFHRQGRELFNNFAQDAESDKISISKKNTSNISA